MLLVLFIACFLALIAFNECSVTSIDFLHNTKLEFQFLQQSLFIATICLSFCVRLPFLDGTENILLISLFNAITCWLLAFLLAALVAAVFVLPLLIKFLRTEN